MLKARGSEEKLTLNEAKDELNQAKKTSIKVVGSILGSSDLYSRKKYS